MQRCALGLFRTALCLVIILIILGMKAVQSEIPNVINYQGFLTKPNGSPVNDGDYSIVFRIHDSASGGAVLWTSGAQSVTVINGMFVYYLGANVPFPDDLFTADTNRYLGIAVAGDPELSPRTRLCSSPYAFTAKYADTAAFAQNCLGSGWIVDGSRVILASLSDSVGIGTATPTAPLEVTTDLAPLGNAAIRVTNSNPANQNGFAFETVHEDVSRIRIAPDWISIRDADSSDVIDLNAHADLCAHFRRNVLIGSATPDEQLTVGGNVHVTGDLIVDGSTSAAIAIDYGYENDVPECGTREVHFDVSFTSPPVVIAGYKGDHECDEHGNWFVYDVTTTGFILRNGRPNASEGRSAYWIAVGPRQ